MYCGEDQCSLDPGIVSVVVRILVYPGDNALFHSVCSLLCALELSFGILELYPGECRNPLKFLIVENVFLGALVGRPPLYPYSKRVVNEVNGYNKG